MKRPLRYYYLKVVRQSGTPDYIAGGLALGVFLSLVLPPFVQMITAFILAFLLGLNRLSALIGCLVSNPFTYPFILAVQFFAGMMITGTPMPEHVPGTYEDVWLYLTDFKASWPLIRAFMIGAVVTGIIAAVIGYFLTRMAVRSFRYRRKLHEEKRRLVWKRPRVEVSPRVEQPTDTGVENEAPVRQSDAGNSKSDEELLH